MDNATGHVTAPRGRIDQCVHREAGLHPGIHGVAHDPPAERVLDRAEIELSLISPVFRDVGEAELVEVIRGEVSLHEVLVNGRAGALAVLPWFLPEDRPPLVVSADPPRGPLTHRLAGRVGFCDQEPGSELGVMAVVSNKAFARYAWTSSEAVTWCFSHR